MSADLERRLALQAARGIAAIEALARIRELSQDAQASRDEAKVRYDTSLEQINSVFTRSVLTEVNLYADRLMSLEPDASPDDDEDEF